MSILLDSAQKEWGMHVADAGIPFILTVKDQNGDIVDVSTATSMVINFKSPAGVVTQKTLINYTDGTDGVVAYTLESGLLDVNGIWTYQTTIILPSGTWHSNIVEFTVYKNIS